VLAVLVAIAIPRLRGAIARQPEIAAAAAAYFVWALFGQNIAYKPRHFLPLAPLAIVALAGGADRLARRAPRAAMAATAVLAIEWLADGAALVAAHRDPSPAAAIVAHLRDHADDRVVLTADLGRMIADGAPTRSVREVKSAAALADGAALDPTNVLITSEALSADARRALADRGLVTRVVFARPRSRYVDSLWNELALIMVERR
jgi:predicted aconitase